MTRALLLLALLGCACIHELTADEIDARRLKFAHAICEPNAIRSWTIDAWGGPTVVCAAPDGGAR